MAQIEEFLRTGQAPPGPSEPEPARSTPAPPTRPYEPGAVDFRAGGAPAGRPAGVRGRLSDLRATNFPVLRTWRRPAQGGTSGSIDRAWAWLRRPIGESHSDRGVGFSDGSPTGTSAGRPVPVWTPGRVIIVVSLLVALIAGPVIYDSQSKHSSAGPTRTTTPGLAAAYTFLRQSASGVPFRWNPCTPIHYLLNLTAAPVTAQDDIVNAIAEIRQRTGIQFIDDGTTSAFPSTSSIASGSVVIAWATPAQSTALRLPTTATDVTADDLVSTSAAASIDGNTGNGVYVSGSMVISSAVGTLPSGFVPGGFGVLMLNQMGRLLGLGPVSTPNEIMNPDVLTSSITGYGVGDLAGLNRLGTSAGCVQVPANPAS
jgi:hypothetical protein